MEIHDKLNKQIKLLETEQTEASSDTEILAINHKLDTLLNQLNALTIQVETLRWHFH